MTKEDFIKKAIIYIAGNKAEDIAELLNSKKHVNEFIIAKKMDLTINQTRNILYKISDYGLVTSIREKDDKKGWYTYFWKLEVRKTLEFYKKVLEKNKEKISAQIRNRENERFYICERCNVELTESEALFHDFTCKECGDLLKIKDNAKLLNALRKNLKKFEREIALLDEEIQDELEKEEKRHEKAVKKEATKKKSAKKKSSKKKSSKKTKRKSKISTSSPSQTKKGEVKKKKKTTKKKSAKKKSSKKKSSKKSKSKKKTIKKKTVKKKKKKAVKKKTAKKKSKKKSAKKKSSKKKSSKKKKK